MSYDYDFAKKLKKMNEKSPYEANWYRAICVKESPLTFSIIDGNLMYSDEQLSLTAVASAKDWKAGDEAGSILSGEGLLIVDKLAIEGTWYKAICTSIAPLTFSIVNGRYSFKESTLFLTSSAGGFAVGDTAAALMSHDGLLVFDKF